MTFLLRDVAQPHGEAASARFITFTAGPPKNVRHGTFLFGTKRPNEQIRSSRRGKQFVPTGNVLQCVKEARQTLRFGNAA